MSASQDQGLSAFLEGLGVALYGYADVAGLFGGAWSAWPRAISIALELPRERLVGVGAGGPTPLYYDTYLETNARLNRISAAVEQWLSEQGYGACAFAATVKSAELDTGLGEQYTAPVQHKTVATRAGLGWIGRNALLVTPRWGPRVRLATVFTDMPLSLATPIVESRCGACEHCVQKCPAGAIHGAAWVVGTSRAELVDVERCRRMAERLMQERVGVNEAVCGVCIAVCPFSKMSQGEK